MRGGAWNVSSATLDVFNRSSVDPVGDSSNIGFRVASVFTPASPPGNFDLDGDVDGFDFLKWQRGESPNPLSESDPADWEANYGTVISPFTAASTTVQQFPARCL